MKNARPVSAVDKALEEKDRLYRRYRAAKRAQLEELFGQEPRLKAFHATLGHFGIDDAERMINYVHTEAQKWLRAAPADTRFAALELVSYRIQRIRARAGLVPLDDPLPGEDDDLFRLCKKELGQ
jgi:hypothetical protein